MPARLAHAAAVAARRFASSRTPMPITSVMAPAMAQPVAPLMGVPRSTSTAPLRKHCPADYDGYPTVNGPLDLAGHEAAGQHVNPLQEPDNS
jgi:hypothetical protein